ncbi:MAG: kynurenine 3-monooxygenase [Alteromonas sp.]|mgnify:CR=1 FL=1|nr:kynurenine 3-monooxygenase [Alteromonas sp.]MAY23346.1 kynurenine 3-monooxygenase [Flavobacteriaceae bacterium]|tara:strand:+ start:51857 stop:53254 length:1398 start_codon:yes stop_codon:yes gene_type:complete
MQTKEHILIVGAGLCGSLLALRLAQRGYQITLTEKRPDLRKVTQDAGRSINLALSDRGLKGLRLAGLEEKALELCIPMNGRMIHPENGDPFLSPYSGREGEYINSISRPGLNMLLLDALDEMPNVTTLFNLGCRKIDLENATGHFKNHTTQETETITADIVMGTDGAGSAVRKSMFEHKKFRFSFSQQWLSHGYKELEIRPTKEGEYKTFKNALHIWPRGKDMLIALPNLDGSFTVTLFLPYDHSDYSFENLNTPESVTEYFQKEFPDALELMPDLAEQYFENPMGTLGTIKCSPWHCYGKNLILGDAAHAIVPFYGQGMNASFEDVVVFDEVLEQYEGDWERVFYEYEKARKKDTDAIADLAVDNFHEMKEHTASALFQQKRKLEIAFETQLPEAYSSKYSLVTFNEDIPYSEAMQRGRAQDKAILNLLDDGQLTEAMTLEEKLALVIKETNDILHDDAVAKNV